MKLKTLKELKGRISPITGEKGKPINQVSTDILKQEAIKHLKEKRKKIHKLGPNIATVTPQEFKSVAEALAVAKWIHLFFNITNEDLK